MASGGYMGINRDNAIRQIITLMILVSLLTCSFATFAKKKLPGMSYLIEGVDRIYIVDESHCSGPTNMEDAGRVYLIEGKEKIEVLKEKFNKWKLDNEYGMCACGGPDKHYYCFREKDQTTYWGVDCDTYLNNLEMPVDLNAIINPKYDTFLGIPTGYALIADVPLEFSEKDIYAQAESSGIQIFYRQGERQYVQQEQIKWTAPFEIVLRTAVNGEEDEINIRNNKKLSNRLDNVFNKWMENVGAVKLLLAEDKKREGISGPQSVVINKTIYLSNLPENIKTTVTYQVGGYSVLVEEINQRTKEEQNKLHLWEITILVPSSNSEEEARKVSAAIPMLKNVKCICDRLPF